MNDMIYETIMWIDKDKISFIKEDLFVLEMQKYGIAVKIVSDDIISSSYRINVQRRNLNVADMKIIARYINEHNFHIKTLTGNFEWINFMPEFYAKVYGINYVPQQNDSEMVCEKPKYNSDDLSTIF